ncbi:MAG: flavin reductase family protein [Myxococcota bacterium]|nr:flavin reductase family protein [Myxococcota bacterium]
MAVSVDEFKAAMSLRAGGVAIVTARSGETVHGMTVTDYVGVSADPPLALVCADKTSNTLGVIRDGRCFAINLLSVAQVELSNRFASKRHEWERFDGLACTAAVTGAPLLPDAVASLDCALEAEHDAGDHVIFIGRIEQVETRDLEPLVYLAGRYGSVAPLDG